MTPPPWDASLRVAKPFEKPYIDEGTVARKGCDPPFLKEFRNQRTFDREWALTSGEGGRPHDVYPSSPGVIQQVVGEMRADHTGYA